jgi:hypothetical protein
MAKAKLPEENIPKSTRQVVGGNDARVTVNIFSPDHEPQSYTYRITNIRGNSSHVSREPKNIMSAIISGIIGKYGS